MPVSQYREGRVGSSTMLEGMLSTFADPAPVPSACQLTPPSVLDQSPWRAMPAINMSRSRFALNQLRVPQVESSPAKFAVALIHGPSGTLPPEPPAPLVVESPVVDGP